MPAILNIKKESTVTPVFDFLDETNGFDLPPGGYTPIVGDGTTPYVQETLTLTLHAASQDALAASIQALSALIDEIARSIDHPTRPRYYLQAKLEDESLARQALLLSLAHQPMSSLYSPQVVSGVYLQEYRVTLWRTPLWEAPSNDHNLNCPDLSSLGGYFDATASTSPIPGDRDARIRNLTLLGEQGNTGSGLNKIWLGFRSDRQGTRSNFVPVWNLRKAAYFGPDTTGGLTNPDATAQDGYKAVITFASSASLQIRAVMTAYNASGVTTRGVDQQGRFLVLGRLKNSAAGQTRLRLLDGMYANGDFSSLSRHPRISVKSTVWQLYELGEVSLPAQQLNTNSNYRMDSCSLGLEAERVEGACSLEVDSFILIPTLEGFVYLDGLDINAGGGGMYRRAFYRQDETGLLTVEQEDNVQHSIAIFATARASRGFPTGEVSVVVAAQRKDSSVKTDNISLWFDLQPTWQVLRGAVIS